MFLGLRKPTAEEIHEEWDAKMRQEYFDPIERFPERIDQLLNAINRVCSHRIHLDDQSFFSYICNKYPEEAESNRRLSVCRVPLSMLLSKLFICFPNNNANEKDKTSTIKFLTYR